MTAKQRIRQGNNSYVWFLFISRTAANIYYHPDCNHSSTDIVGTSCTTEKNARKSKAKCLRGVRRREREGTWNCISRSKTTSTVAKIVVVQGGYRLWREEEVVEERHLIRFSMNFLATFVAMGKSITLGRRRT